MTNTPVIDVKDLSFTYNEEPLLEHVTFSVSEGDFAAIIGSNGTGKSTMIKLLLGFLTPKSGKILLNNQDPIKATKSSIVGYVPQNSGNESGKFPATALEVCLLGLYPQIGLFRFFNRRHKQLALDALASVGMKDHANDLISELSGGQQQRVMLARVLVNNPKILLLDEPTVGIDPSAVTVLLEILHRINIEHNVTIIMVTHDLSRMAPYTNRVLCLSDHNFSENEIPENLIIHAHPTSHEHIHTHIHCANCEIPHDDEKCEVCSRHKESEKHI